MANSGQADRDEDSQRGDDEAEIRGLHGRVLAGWNEASGDAFAAPFSEDADFVAFDGSVARGRERIAEAHQELFDKWLKGSRLVEVRTTVRFLGADVAIVLSVGGTVMRGKSGLAPERDSIQTLVAARGAEGWKFVSFRTPASVPSVPTRSPPSVADTGHALAALLPSVKNNAAQDDRPGRSLTHATGAPPTHDRGWVHSSRKGEGRCATGVAGSEVLPSPGEHLGDPAASDPALLE